MCHQVISILKLSASQMIVVVKTRITKIKGRPEAIKFNLPLIALTMPGLSAMKPHKT